jgi:hypothetical protein
MDGPSPLDGWPPEIPNEQRIRIMSRPPALTAERNSTELTPIRRPSMSRMSMAWSPWLSGAVWPVLALSLPDPALDQPRDCRRRRERVSGATI